MQILSFRKSWSLINIIASNFIPLTTGVHLIFGKSTLGRRFLLPFYIIRSSQNLCSKVVDLELQHICEYFKLHQVVGVLPV